MPIYHAPLEDVRFILNDLLEIGKYSNLKSFAEVTSDIVDAILVEGGRLAEEVLQPLNTVGDQQGCTRHADGTVSPPKGFKEAYQTYVDGGWGGLTARVEHGGQGMPQVLSTPLLEIASAANMAFGMYPGLTRGAYEALNAHGSDELKARFLPKMASGEWSGTMNLTEPHCGTDLGLMRAKAVPQSDGSYLITGTKVFISAGEHDMSDNIIHLVLARMEGAPDGIKGVSLFVVPRHFVDEQGNVCERNMVECGALEEKMGIHGNSTCVMNFDGSVGYLVGEEDKGMRAMFTMMNEARLGVGLQGLSQSEASYQNAVEYAKERVQGRSLTGVKNPDGPADPILVHPDVRRMLMDQKSFNEAARAFLYWTALHGDMSHGSPNDAERERGSDYMALLTPVLKGYLTDKGFQHCVNAQQVYGGHGYIRENGMDQFVRDARIAMIYEGTNGIQALDLVGRKMASDGGRGISDFLAELLEFCEENQGDENLDPFLDATKQVRGQLEEATNWFMENALSNFDHAGAGSTDYLHLFGITVLTYMWARMAKIALGKLKEDPQNQFFDAKVKTGRYYIERQTPDAAAHLARIKSGADPVMALQPEQF